MTEHSPRRVIALTLTALVVLAGAGGAGLSIAASDRAALSVERNAGGPASVGDDCLDCHQPLKTELQSRSRHEPFMSGDCDACHRQFHKGDASQLTAAEEIDICVACHPDSASGFSHPVGPDVLDELAGTPLTCTSSCHAPHGSPYRALGRAQGDMLCLGCHRIPGSDRSKPSTTEPIP